MVGERAHESPPASFYEHKIQIKLAGAFGVLATYHFLGWASKARIHSL